MWVYILNIISIPIYSLLIKDKKKFIILVAIQLFLILALRSITLGIDLDNYSGGYDYIRTLDFGQMMSTLRPSGMAELIYPFGYENGYVIFDWLSAQLGLSFHGFLVLCAAINIGSVGLFIYKYSKKPWLSFVIFAAFEFFAFDFGILRHALALSMMLFSYIALDKNKRWQAFLAFVIAFSFHRSVIISLPLLLLYNKLKIITKKRFEILLFVSVLILISSSFIYDNIIFPLMGVMGRDYYVGHGLEMNNMLIILALIAVVVFFFYNFSKIKDRMNSIACYAIIFAVYFAILGLYNDNLARATQFFSIFLVILIPNVFDQYKDQKVVIGIEMVTFLLLLGFMCYTTSGSILDPYVLYQGGLLW